MKTDVRGRKPEAYAVKLDHHIQHLKQLNFDRTVSEIRLISKSRNGKSFMLSIVNNQKGSKRKAWTCHVPAERWSAFRIAYPDIPVRNELQ